MKRIGICVDDFGLKPEVNEAVVQLAAAGVVTATACLSTAPHWVRGAAALRQSVRERLDVGLHLNLTEPLHGTRAGADTVSGREAAGGDLVLPLAPLIARSLLQALAGPRLQATIRRQLDAFEDAWGETPDFIDGHQHVHQLPQVRDHLLNELSRRGYDGLAQGVSRAPRNATRVRPWLRCTAPGEGRVADFKHRVIGWLGARRLAEQARARGYALNRSLLGVYDFRSTVDGYRQLLDTWLTQAQDGDLLMVHPAVPGPHAVTAESGDWPDPIAAARETEYPVLLAAGHRGLGAWGVEAVRMSTWIGLQPR